jgi:hypothetical protein
MLGQVDVVGSTDETDVFHRVVAAATERRFMMELQRIAFAAASTVEVHESASAAVPLAHGSPDR